MINLTIKEIEEWIKKHEKELPEITSQDILCNRTGRLDGMFDLLTFLETKEVK